MLPLTVLSLGAALPCFTALYRAQVCFTALYQCFYREFSLSTVDYRGPPSARPWITEVTVDYRGLPCVHQQAVT